MCVSAYVNVIQSNKCDLALADENYHAGILIHNSYVISHLTLIAFSCAKLFVVILTRKFLANKIIIIMCNLKIEISRDNKNMSVL